MYISPVPLMIIRADTRALIEVNGSLSGECSSDGYVSVPASECGDYYISVLPLDADRVRYPVTRRVSFESGVLTGSVSADVDVLCWPGGVYEFFMRSGVFLRDHGCESPYTLDTLELVQNRVIKRITLYYDSGLRLSVDENGRSVSGYSLGVGTGGSLSLYESGDMRLTVIRIELMGSRERMILLDEAQSSIADVSGSSVSLISGELLVTESLGTTVGHETRTRYAVSRTGIRASETQTGFFTHGYVKPDSGLGIATAFLEAVMLGFEHEALSYLTDGLRQSFSYAEIADFLGAYKQAKPPLSDRSGQTMGLIAKDDSGYMCARMIGFEFKQGLIDNITEL